MARVARVLLCAIWHFVLFVGYVVGVALLVIWAVYLRPQFLGGPMELVGVNGVSMTPTFHYGDLVVVERQASYQVGDIVAFRIPEGDAGAGQEVIHRIVGGDGRTGFITKGDHNDYRDAFWEPTTADIIGKAWFDIPEGMLWVRRVREPIPLACLIGAVTFLLLVIPTKAQRASRGTDSDDAPPPRKSAEQSRVVEPCGLPHSCTKCPAPGSAEGHGCSRRPAQPLDRADRRAIEEQPLGPGEADGIVVSRSPVCREPLAALRAWPDLTVPDDWWRSHSVVAGNPRPPAPRGH